MHVSARVCAAIGAVVMGIVLLTAQASHHEMSAGDCWLKAFKSADADAVAACYLPDAVMWFPDGPMAKGRQAIRDGYAGYFEHYTITDASLTEMGHLDGADSRTAWGTFRIEMVSKADGSSMTEHGRYTDVSRKVGGHWMYAVDHASDDPPPKAAE